MLLRRKFGGDYGKIITNPAATVQAIRERKEEKKDIRACRKLFKTVLDLMDDFDLEDAERHLVLRGFANPLSVLPEASAYLTFNGQGENVSPAPDLTYMSGARDVAQTPGDSAQQHGERDVDRPAASDSDPGTVSLSKRTLDLFKILVRIGGTVLIDGTRVVVKSAKGHLAAEVIVQEVFPCCISFSGTDLMRAIRDTGSPDLTFEDHDIRVGSGARRIPYSGAKVGRIRLSESVFAFPLSKSQVRTLNSATSTSGSKWSIVSDGQHIQLLVTKGERNRQRCEANLEIAGNPAGQRASVLLGDPPKLLPAEYNVRVTREVVEFRAEDITYWQGNESGSRFDDPPDTGETAISAEEDGTVPESAQTGIDAA